MAETLPIFPLSTVLLPGASLPLHIFEPRYRQLTVDLLAGKFPGKSFGIVGTRFSWNKDITELGEVEAVGCTAVLREARRLPDGRFNLVTKGERRFRLLELDSSSQPYLTGVVEWSPDHDVPDTTAQVMPDLASAALAAHRRYCTAAWRREDWVELDTETAPAEVSNLVAADCLLPAADRQRLLEEVCPAKRLQLVRRMLNREAGIIARLRAIPTTLSELGSLGSLN